MRRPVTLPALLAGTILLALVPAASGGGPAALRGQADDLRAENATLQSRSQSVVLELYTLDSRLAAARGRLADTNARLEALRKRQSTVAVGVAVASHAAKVAQDALAERLRQLYEEGEPDPLAVLLGAESLDDAASRLDDLHSVAEQDHAVIHETQTTGKRLARLSRTLSARRAELSSLEDQAAASVAEIESARSARAGYLDQLGNQRALNLLRISSLESQAEEAAAKAAALNAAAAAAPSTTQATAYVPSPVAVVPAPPEGGVGGNTLTVVATAYALTGSTATGAPVGYGVVAVDPSVIPLGTRMTIPGYGEGTAADVGSGISGPMIDLWFPTMEQAMAWGRRTVTITLH